MSRRRKWAIAAGLGFFTLCLGLSYLCWPAPVDEGGDLGNGWRVRYLDAGVGKIKYNSDSTLKQYLRTYAPRAIESQMDRPIRIDQDWGVTDSDLLLLFHVWSPEGRTHDDDDPFYPSLDLIESSGFVFHHPYSGMTSSYFGKEGIGVSTDVGTFPRREPLLHFQLRNGKSADVLMDRVIPNPGYQPNFPEWSTQPLPITQIVPPVSLTLSGITVDQKLQSLQAHLSATATEPSWEHPLISYELCDATGNHGHWLSPFEPAWKVKTRVRRRLEATFHPTEIWKLASLPAPRPKSVVPLRETRTVNGILVYPRQLYGPGKYRIENGVVVMADEKPPSSPLDTSYSNGSSSGSAGTIHYTNIDTDFPALLLEHAELPCLTHLEVRIRDQAGHDLREGIDGERHGSQKGQPYGWFPFQPRADSTLLNIEVVVHKSLEFEFIVKPPVPEATAP